MPNNISVVGRSWRESEQGRDHPVIYHPERRHSLTRHATGSFKSRMNLRNQAIT